MQSRRTPRYRNVEYQPDDMRASERRYTTRTPVQRLERSSQPLSSPLFYGDEEEEQVPCYDGPILKRRATRTENLPGRIPVDRPVETVRPRSGGWWGWVFMGVMFFLAVWLFLTSVVLPWLNNVENHWAYGANPVYHLQAYVGVGDSPNDPSDWYAEISHNQIVVTQVTSSKVTTYPLVWQGSSIDGFIPTLSTSKDTSTGRIDVLVHVGSLLVTMYNNGTGFQGTKP